MSLKGIIDKKIMPYRNEIYGILALWIILFHTTSRIVIPKQVIFLGSFLRMGNISVDVFMFISGYCMCHSWNKMPDVKSFYKKRVLRVAIPYFIISVPFYLWKNIAEFPLYNGAFNVKGFLYDVFTVSFWKNGTQTTWFVTAIMLFYLLVPFFSSVMVKGKKYAFLILAFSYLLNFSGVLKYETYHLISIAIVRLPIFLAGMIVFMYGDEFNIKNVKGFILLFSGVAVLFTLIFPLRDIYIAKIGNKYEPLWFMYEFLVFGLLFCFSFVAGKMNFKLKKLFAFLGGYSLELYLIHVPLLHIKDFYFGRDAGGYLLFLIVPLVSVLLVLIYKMIGDRIKLWINS